MKYQKGDIVTYSRSFIKSIQGHHLASERGTVIAVSQVNNGPTVLRVQWHSGHKNSILASNAVLLKMLPLEPF